MATMQNASKEEKTEELKAWAAACLLSSPDYWLRAFAKLHNTATSSHLPWASAGDVAVGIICFINIVFLFTQSG